MVRGNKGFRRALLYIFASLTVLITVFPFLMMLSTALKTSDEVVSVHPHLIPHTLTWKNFLDVLNPHVFPYWTYFFNSLETSFTTAFISIIIGTLGAYSFARLEFKGRGILQKGVLFIYMFSGLLLIVPLFKMVSFIGLYDTKLSLIIVYLVLTMPVTLYMLGNYFRSIPESLEEASLIDGLSRFQVIYKIIVPLSLPAITTVFIYVFMISWNDFLFASIFINSEDKMTLPIGLNHLFQSKNYIWGRMMAASLLTAVPVIVLFGFIEKYLAGGLTEGSIKE